MASVDRSLVAHLPLFAGVAAAELDELLKEARAVRHLKNSNVFEQGQEAHSLFLLLHGHVRAEKTTPDGQQIVVPTDDGDLLLIPEPFIVGKVTGLERVSALQSVDGKPLVMQ